MNKRGAALSLALLVTVPGVAAAQIPEVPLPPAPAPQLPVPVPTVPSVPSLPAPSLPAPSLPAPSLPAPSLPAPSLPAPAPAPAGAPSVGSGTSAQPGAPAQAPSSGAATGSSRDSRGAASSGGGAATSGGRGAAIGASTAELGPTKPSEAQVRRRDRRLRTEVRRLRGCLPVLTRLQRRVVALRTGIGKGGPRSRERVARILDRSETRIGKIERRALRRLKAADRSGRCEEIERESALTAPDGDASAAAALAGSSLVDAGIGGGVLAQTVGGDAEAGKDAGGGKGGDGRSGVKGESREGAAGPGLVSPLGGPPDITLPIIGLLLLAGAVLGIRGIVRWVRDSEPPAAS